MSLDLLIVLAVLLGAVVLFVTELVRVDLVALLVLGVLLVTAVVTPAEGFAGFSNEATVTVAAMFVLSAGLYRTGMLNRLGDALARASRHSFWLALLAMMIVIAGISAFINNTAAVAVFLPIVLAVARDSRISASKFLMPLSFASMFGGVCTLIGTSTNILVNVIAREHGLPGFGMFEFARLGVPFLLVGTAYMVLVGVRLIPDRRGAGGLTESFRLDDYLAEVVLLPEAPSVGKTLRDAPLVTEMDLDVLEILRGEQRIAVPFGTAVLRAGDILRVRCSLEDLARIGQRHGVRFKAGGLTDTDLQSPESVLVEAVVAPGGILDGRSLADVDFRNRFGATTLALRHRGALLRERIARTPLSAGDALLVEVQRHRLPFLRQHEAFVVVSEVAAPVFRVRKFLPALAIMLAVVALPTAGIMPIAASATAGAVLMILTRCLSLEEAYEAIDWQVIFLLAGVLTLGVALDKTGGSTLLSSFLVETVGTLGPAALVSAFYLLATLLTAIMSNNATAVLLAPIAIAAGVSLGVDPRPFLLAIMFGASTSFMTPVGYQTNTMVFGAGQYRFADFIRVGGPLTIVFWVMASVLIPRLWGF